MIIEGQEFPNIVKFDPEVDLKIPTGKKVVFTNGCFDILHPGHISYLQEAASLGDFLVVGLNSDTSVKLLDKGPNRPISKEEHRAVVISSIDGIDLVVIFSEETPENLIKKVNPDVLVKGGDWKPEQVAGGEYVLNNGGEVSILKFLDGYSTTAIEKQVISEGNKS